MSLLKAIKAQLGLSVTPANNFVLDASADNGTMKLARESGQDIMTVDAAGKVGFPQNVNTQLGIGQTWQEVVRVTNTPYVNQTSKPIMVSMTLTSLAGTSVVEILSGGMQIATAYATANVDNTTIAAIIPPGETYMFKLISGSSSISVRELR